MNVISGNDTTALRLEINQSHSQGSRSGNPGLKDATALRLAADSFLINSRSSEPEENLIRSA